MKQIKDELLSHQDIKYRDFNSRIIPNIDKEKMLGVRLPIIRKMAKELVKNGNYKEFIKKLPHDYYEENLLHASVLSLLQDLDELLIEIERFLPYIDNWAVSDCLKPHAFMKDPDRILDKVKEWINTKDEYYIRFGVVTLLNFYLGNNFKEEINNLVCSIKSDKYYVNMAVAWYFSYALIKQYDVTISIFENKKLDPWVHNKSIQKAIESYRISNDTKNYLRSLKVK